MDSSATSNTALPRTEPQIDQHILIDIPEGIKPALHDVYCIYKVPPNLRKVNDGEAYTPQLISIGPFHHDPKSKSNPMHTQKQRYFLAFRERVTNKKALAKYKDYLKKNIDMIRQCYWGLDADSPSDDEFVDMILLDSVFILELFLRKSEESVKERDYMFTTPWIYKTIRRDLLLLENQLPIFVLEELHRRVRRDNNSLSFLDLAYSYFEDYNPQRSKDKDKHQNEEMIKNCKHFTDLLRCFYLPKEVHAKEWKPQKHFPDSGEYKSLLKTAAKLNEAGVSFERVDNKSLLEINLDKVPVLNWFLCLGCLPCFKVVKSRLQIPQFKVHGRTDCVLRNLIALEQWHYPNQPFICNYVSLLDSLINTQEDVEFLVDKDIIVHELGSHKELATMINNLCKHVVVTCNYYGKTSEKLNKHYYNYWKHHMGMLRSVYFRNPWRVSSTIVGIVIFLFAIVNFLRLTGVYHPKY